MKLLQHLLFYIIILSSNIITNTVLIENGEGHKMVMSISYGPVYKFNINDIENIKDIENMKNLMIDH